MTLSEYRHLIRQIIESVSSSNKHSLILNSLKDLYKDEINSARRFEKITTIGQLLTILERRDVLNEDKIGPLKDIAERLADNNLLRKLGHYEMSHVAREYGNYYVSETAHKTTSREFDYSYNNPYKETLSKRKSERINNIISEEIGTFWKDFGRNLGISEGRIDQIDAKHFTLKSKAEELLEIYKESRSNPDTWFVDICDALDQARRKDVSKTLRKVILMNI